MKYVQKALQLPFFSIFFSSFLALFLDGLPKAILYFSSTAALRACDQDWTF